MVGGPLLIAVLGPSAMAGRGSKTAKYCYTKATVMAIYPLRTPAQPRQSSRKPADNPIVYATAPQREAAIAAIKVATALATERLHVITDGVIDAVIQTEDVSALAKDIALANSKRVTLTELLCDVCMFIVLERVGEIVEETVLTLAEGTAKAVLSTNTAFRTLPLAEEAADLSPDAVRKALNSIVGETPRVNGRNWALYSEGVAKAIEDKSSKAASAIVDATKRRLESPSAPTLSF